MICDRIENLIHYNMHAPYVKEIASYLSKTDVAALAPGHYEINDDMFVNVEEYAPGDNSLFEAHRAYIDLQFLVEGDEEIACVPLADCVVEKDYDEAIDAGFYKPSENAPEFKLFVRAGTFAVFEPRDAHSPGRKYKAGHAKKLIFKIKVQ